MSSHRKKSTSRSENASPALAVDKTKKKNRDRDDVADVDDVEDVAAHKNGRRPIMGKGGKKGKNNHKKDTANEDDDVGKDLKGNKGGGQPKRKLSKKNSGSRSDDEEDVDDHDEDEEDDEEEGDDEDNALEVLASNKSGARTFQEVCMAAQKTGALDGHVDLTTLQRLYNAKFSPLAMMEWLVALYFVPCGKGQKNADPQRTANGLISTVMLLYPGFGYDALAGAFRRTFGLGTRQPLANFKITKMVALTPKPAAARPNYVSLLTGNKVSSQSDALSLDEYEEPTIPELVFFEWFQVGSGQDEPITSHCILQLLRSNDRFHVASLLQLQSDLCQVRKHTGDNRVLEGSKSCEIICPTSTKGVMETRRETLLLPRLLASHLLYTCGFDLSDMGPFALLTPYPEFVYEAMLECVKWKPLDGHLGLSIAKNVAENSLGRLHYFQDVDKRVYILLER